MANYIHLSLSYLPTTEEERKNNLSAAGAILPIKPYNGRNSRDLQGGIVLRAYSHQRRLITTVNAAAAKSCERTPANYCTSKSVHTGNYLYSRKYDIRIFNNPLTVAVDLHAVRIALLNWDRRDAKSLKC